MGAVRHASLPLALALHLALPTPLPHRSPGLGTEPNPRGNPPAEPSFPKRTRRQDGSQARIRTGPRLPHPWLSAPLLRLLQLLLPRTLTPRRGLLPSTPAVPPGDRLGVVGARATHTLRQARGPTGRLLGGALGRPARR